MINLITNIGRKLLASIRNTSMCGGKCNRTIDFHDKNAIACANGWAIRNIHNRVTTNWREHHLIENEVVCHHHHQHRRHHWDTYL